MTTPDPSRFPRGLNNVFPTDRAALYGLPDPTKWITYFNDFVNTDSLPASTDVNYIITSSGGSIGQLDGNGGLTHLSNSATDDNAIWVQKVGEAFRWSATKKLIFVSRFKVSDATQSDFVMGLQITDNSPLDVTDGIFFIKADGSTTVTLRVEKNDAAATATAATAANDTWMELAFVYEGKSFQSTSNTTTYPFSIYLNNGYVTSVEATTTVPDDEDLTISFGIQNGEGVAKTMTIDYVFCGLER